MPGMTHWQHPRFFAYFPANSSPPSVLAEMLTAALGAQCMLWQTSPAATELETRLLEWLGQAVGLPEGFAGVIQDSASSAILCALADGARAGHGLGGERARPGRGGRAAGGLYLRPGAFRDREGRKDRRLRPRAGPPYRDRQGFRHAGGRAGSGHSPRPRRRSPGRPASSPASGTTGVGAIDRLDEIGRIAEREDVFFHVDAAWAGGALVCEEHRWMLRGDRDGR